MATPTTVPYSSLIAADEINARAKTSECLDELAASIAAKGLIQPLAVRPADAGASGKGAQRYEIIDGRRRYQALAQLVKSKRMRRDEPVPVLIRDEDDAEALETSLMANTVRLPMHPIDQHEVFARISDKGVSPAEIAARFGLAERTVKQHLALGRLAPEVRQAWRKGKIDADTARAFAVEPDAGRQAEALKKLGARASQWSVRGELAPRRVRVDQSDEMALIGEEAYIAAGGVIDEDLFEDARYIGDVALLERMAREKLQAECDRLKADGWSWAEIEDHDGGLVSWNCDHVLGDDRDVDDTDETYEFSPEQKAQSGCVVSIGYDGNLQVQTGLIRPANAASATGFDDEDQSGLEDFTGEDDDGSAFYGDDDPARAPSGRLDEGESEGATEDSSPRLSGALVESLTTQQTIVAQRVLARDPVLALKALLATWAGYRGYGTSPVRATRDGYRDGPRTLTNTTQSFIDAMAADGETVDELAEALAPLIAAALDLRCHNAASSRAAEDALVAGMAGDDYLREMRAVFVPADYFARVPKALAIEALEEMHDAGRHFGLPGRDDLERMKKSELAQWAAEQAAACGWLPDMLRHPAYALIISNKPSAEVAA